ncbi:unnamed protein product, partial [marine sediment metagenome]
PMLIAANKIDVEGAEEHFEKLKKDFPKKKFVPCSAEAELALRKAEADGIIEYIPGDSDFKMLKADVPEKQKKALEWVREHILAKWKSTGVQEAINKTFFELLNLIVVYPVEDATKWVSGKGNVLPDAHLLPNGATAYDLAVKIHSSFGERFIAAVDCRTGQKIGKETQLKNNDVVKIQLSH